MAREALVERITTRIAAPPRIDASALAADFDRVARRGLGDVLDGVPAAAFPEGALLIVRRVAVRLRLKGAAARGGDFGAVETAWRRAIREGLAVAAADALSGAAPVVTDEVAFFPSDAALARAAVAILPAAGAVWWLPAAVEATATRSGMAPPAPATAGSLLRVVAAAAPRETAGALRAAAAAGGPRAFAVVDRPNASATARTLLSRMRASAPPASGAAPPPASRRALEIALAAAWPAAAAWAGTVPTETLVLAAAVIASDGAAHPAARATLSAVAAAFLAPTEDLRAPPAPKAPFADARAGAQVPGEPGRAAPEAGEAERPAQTPATPASAAAEGIPVALGGLLFLVRPALALLERAGPDGASPAPEALHALGVRLIRRIAANAGRQPQERAAEAPLLAVLGAREAPADEAERMALLQEPAPAASAWAACAMDTLSANLPSAPAGTDPWERLIARAGVLVLSPERATLTMPLSEVDPDVRRRGWDVDPGWTPAIGRIVRFVYCAQVGS